jgi:DNA-binding NarL/FixJ family response regulator
MEKQIYVVIADSQFLVTKSLTMILLKDGRFNVIDIVTGKDRLFETLERVKANLLIIDPFLADIGAIPGLKDIKNAFPEIEILVVSNHLKRRDLQELNTIGINCFVLKTCTEDEINGALNAAIRCKKYYSGEILEILLGDDEKKITGEDSRQLTASELEIVRLISDGLTTPEIAARKFISPHTVITHRKNIFRKLGVSSISELIMYAIKAGWIDIIEYHI